MTWQLVIILQIIASSLMTIYTRHVSLSVKRVFFGVAVLSYVAIAGVGWLYYSLATGGVMTLPGHEAWLYLLVEGVCIPAAWLVQYRLIAYIGATGAVIVAMLNTLMAALAGVIFLHDTITTVSILGGVMILTGAMIALRLQPDAQHVVHVPFLLKLTLVVIGAVLYSVGMYAEKLVVNETGPWGYMGFGWSMQAIGAVALFTLFGGAELAYLTHSAIRKGVMLGLITSIAGGLYIYALSIGSLSHTIIAISGKAALVVVLAAIFLRERNAWPWRIIAIVLTTLGLILFL